MFQMVLIIVYLLIFLRGLQTGLVKFRKTARLILVITGGLGLLVLTSYKYMNFLRYAFLNGASDFMSALQIAAQSDIAQARSSFVELFNRITGIDAFSAVIHLGEALSFSVSLSDLITGRLMQRFSDIVFIDNNASFSMTLLGSWYAYGGLPAIIIGFCITGSVFAFLQHLILRIPSVPHNMRLAFLPVFWIMCVQLTLGGNPIIWLKTMMVTLPSAYFISLFAFVPTRRRGSVVVPSQVAVTS